LLCILPPSTKVLVAITRPRRNVLQQVSRRIRSWPYPVEAISTMTRIAEEVERDPIYRAIIYAQRAEPEATGADAIAAAARQISAPPVAQGAAPPVRRRPQVPL